MHIDLNFHSHFQRPLLKITTRTAKSPGHLTVFCRSYPKRSQPKPRVPQTNLLPPDLPRQGRKNLNPTVPTRTTPRPARTTILSRPQSDPQVVVRPLAAHQRRTKSSRLQRRQETCRTSSLCWPRLAWLPLALVAFLA